MGWYDDRNPLVYEHYQGRAFLMDGANAGIVLYNLSEADSGQYQVELSGPGHIDKAHLQVYNGESLCITTHKRLTLPLLCLLLTVFQINSILGQKLIIFSFWSFDFKRLIR